MASSTPTIKILLVDDEPDIRETLGEALTEHGYDVAVAADGAEALARLQDAPLPALILLDLRMPVMDGAAFRAAQLADPTLAAVPVVIVTANVDIAARATALGAVAHLRKPTRLALVLAAIRAHARVR